MPNYRISSQLVFENNTLNSYLGRVKYYEGDMYLYSETTKIYRLNEEDALYDAKILAEDH